MRSRSFPRILKQPKVVGLVAAIALAALALVTWTLIRPGDDAWARLQRGGALRVAVDPSFPPFDHVNDEGQLVGFDIELARELGRRLDVPVEFKAIAFDGLIDAIIADKADVVISAFPYDPRLTQDVRYTQPYFEGGLVLVTRADGPVTQIDDLPGHRIAVEWGSLGDAWARANGLTVSRQETALQSLERVGAGEAEAALVDVVTASLYTEGGLDIRTPPLESDPYVIVLSNQAPILSDAIEEILSEIMLDGTWERLISKYFSLLPPKPISG